MWTGPTKIMDAKSLEFGFGPAEEGEDIAFSSRFSSNSEDLASELLEIFEEMFHRY